MANTTGKKTGGRKAGTPNRLTNEIRTVLKDVIYKEIELLHKHLDKLNIKDRLELLTKLMPYVLPKVEPDNYTAKDDRNTIPMPVVNINFRDDETNPSGVNRTDKP